jgi:diketogulonate reductase-like aldo/keto reductase
MPLLGLGTWRSEPGKVALAVKTALLAGYKHIDTAWVYQNEQEVGQGIRDAMKADQRITRESIFVTTKLWNIFHKPEQVEEACNESAEKLGLKYVDLYLMHWPIAMNRASTGLYGDVIDVPLQDTWVAMEKLAAKGKVRSIGVSNFNVDQIEELWKHAKFKPVVNQCEAHPHFPNIKVAEFCKQKGMLFTAYSSLGSIFQGQDSCLDESIVKNLAKKYGKSPAQILYRWGLQRGYAIIPKTVNPERVLENSQIFDFELSSRETDALTALGQGKDRKLNPSWATHFKQN